MTTPRATAYHREVKTLLCCALIACGSTSQETTVSQPATRSATSAAPAPTPDETAAHEREQRAEIVEAHRKIEDQQQDALGASCDAPAPTHDHERCLPSCYPTEAPDPRAGRKLAGSVVIEHLICERPGGGPLQMDELAPKLKAAVFRKRLPAPHKAGSWQAAIETALHDQLPRGDVIVVAGAFRGVKHPLTHESLRCVTVAHYARSPKHPIDGCGGLGDVTCEATGNPAARAIDVVHYRLEEARRLQTGGKTADCQQAALEAVAVARGLPRWRQYAKLNVGHWTDNLSYRTRFDGTLGEDELFAATATLGSAAEGIYTACGGPSGAPTTAEQEQSFHTCW